ncbi:ABC transporter permease [Actinoplanes sp. NPDC049265]|uniref:ABC transporter permease n=1 Tax=Actinoplanes sp. NPDC049265 TaxID=3363902 RepID=UPI00371F125D
MTTTSTATPAVERDDDESGTLLQRLAGTQAVWILGVLVVIIAFFAISGGDRFLSADNFSLITQNLAVLAVLGAGMTFVIITSGIDLSIGSVLVFASVISAKLMASMGGDGAGVVIAGILAAVVAGAAWGWLNGFLIAYAKIPALIVTLGTLSAALGLAYVLSKGVNITVDATSLTDFGIYTRFAGLPALPLLALVIVVIFGIALHRTRFGRHTYAIGSNQEAARRVGIRVDRHLMLVYLITGVLGGIGAVMYLAQFGTTTIGGQSLTNLNVIAAVVIGGTSIFGGYGSMFGTMVGLFIPAILQSGFVIIGVDPFWQGVAVGAVLIAAVYVDQTRRAAAQRGAPRGKQSKEGTKA